jgi:hypothetical protein
MIITTTDSRATPPIVEFSFPAHLCGVSFSGHRRDELHELAQPVLIGSAAHDMVSVGYRARRMDNLESIEQADKIEFMSTQKRILTGDRQPANCTSGTMSARGQPRQVAARI